MSTSEIHLNSQYCIKTQHGNEPTCIALQWNTKLQLNLNLAAPYNVHVGYQARETVLHWDMQTPRGENTTRNRVFLTKFELFGQTIDEKRNTVLCV